MTQEVQLGANVSLTTFMRMVGGWRRNLAQQLEHTEQPETAQRHLGFCGSLTEQDARAQLREGEELARLDEHDDEPVWLAKRHRPVWQASKKVAGLRASLTTAVSLLDDLHAECEASKVWQWARSSLDTDCRYFVHVAELTEVLHVLAALGVNPHTDRLP